MAKIHTKNPMLRNIFVILRFQLKWGSLRSFCMSVRIIWDVLVRRK